MQIELPKMKCFRAQCLDKLKLRSCHKMIKYKQALVPFFAASWSAGEFFRRQLIPLFVVPSKNTPLFQRERARKPSLVRNFYTSVDQRFMSRVVYRACVNFIFMFNMPKRHTPLVLSVRFYFCRRNARFSSSRVLPNLTMAS